MVHTKSDAAKAAWISRFDEAAASASAVSTATGALAGLSFAVKDNIDVAGLPSTAACAAFARSMAKRKCCSPNWPVAANDPLSGSI